jgi:hypothetical protein
MLDSGRGYLPMFLFAGSAYLLALVWIRLLVPKLLPLPLPKLQPAPAVS